MTLSGAKLWFTSQEGSCFRNAFSSFSQLSWEVPGAMEKAVAFKNWREGEMH